MQILPKLTVTWDKNKGVALTIGNRFAFVFHWCAWFWTPLRGKTPHLMASLPQYEFLYPWGDRYNSFLCFTVMHHAIDGNEIENRIKYMRRCIANKQVNDSLKRWSAWFKEDKGTHPGESAHEAAQNSSQPNPDVVKMLRQLNDRNSWLSEALVKMIDELEELAETDDIKVEYYRKLAAELNAKRMSLEEEITYITELQHTPKSREATETIDGTNRTITTKDVEVNQADWVPPYEGAEESLADKPEDKEDGD